MLSTAMEFFITFFIFLTGRNSFRHTFPSHGYVGHSADTSRREYPIKSHDHLLPCWGNAGSNLQLPRLMSCSPDGWTCTMRGGTFDPLIFARLRMAEEHRHTGSCCHPFIYDRIGDREDSPRGSSPRSASAR